MDYSLATLKLFASHLAGSTTAPSSEGSSMAQMLFGIRFQGTWIQVPPSLSVLSFPFLCSALTARCSRQGVVVRADYNIGDGRLFVDDGSCVTELMLRPEDAKGQPWRPGSPNLSDFCLALSVSCV
ncbi:Fatty acyl-CoA reductase [Hordeum vulgare]|nr:Fatty acyl-CoA reductase [Hordeum vulgare]